MNELIIYCFLVGFMYCLYSYSVLLVGNVCFGWCVGKMVVFLLIDMFFINIWYVFLFSFKMEERVVFF